MSILGKESKLIWYGCSSPLSLSLFVEVASSFKECTFSPIVDLSEPLHSRVLRRRGQELRVHPHRPAPPDEELPRTKVSRYKSYHFLITQVIDIIVWLDFTHTHRHTQAHTHT